MHISTIEIDGLSSTGILYGKTFDTTFDTSKFDFSDLNRKSQFYFADKRNPFNRYGVKYAWGWTFSILLLHLLTAPPRGQRRLGDAEETPESRHFHQRLSKGHRLLEVLLATAAWALMTQAILAGTSITDLLRRSTGGTCELRLPSSLQSDPTFSNLQTIDSQPIIRTSDAATGDSLAADLVPSEVYLSLPMQYCSHNIPITPSSHPELYSYLSPKAKQEGAEGKITPSQVQGGDLSLRARITQGFDLSGHVFLLVLSTGLILRHVSPVLRRWLKKGKIGRGETLVGSTHTGVTILGTLVASVWLWVSSSSLEAAIAGANRRFCRCSGRRVHTFTQRMKSWLAMVSRILSTRCDRLLRFILDRICSRRSQRTLHRACSIEYGLERCAVRSWPRT